MLKILAIETSSDACSVALSVGDCIKVDSKILSRSHNSAILPMIEQILSANDIDVVDLSHIVYASGPGSFTGLRIGSAMAKGLAMAANIAVIALPSLQIMAMHMHCIGVEKCKCILSSHATMCYVADYCLNEGMPSLSADIKLVSINDLVLSSEDVLLLNGNQTANELLANMQLQNAHHIYPNATDMLLIAKQHHTTLSSSYFHDNIDYVNDYITG